MGSGFGLGRSRPATDRTAAGRERRQRLVYRMDQPRSQGTAAPPVNVPEVPMITEEERAQLEGVADAVYRKVLGPEWQERNARLARERRASIHGEGSRSDRRKA